MDHGWDRVEHVHSRSVALEVEATVQKQVIQLRLWVNQIREAAFRCLPLSLTPQWILHFVDHLQAQVEVLRIFHRIVKLLVKEKDVAIVTRV